MNEFILSIKRIPSAGGYLVELPRYATEGAAGMDLCACIDESTEIKPGEIRLIPAGISIELPDGYGAFVFGRSGLGIKHGVSLANGVGVIDSDYRGQIHVGLINRGGESYAVAPGERMAQLVIMPVMRALLREEELSGTERGAGGFGSTGR